MDDHQVILQATQVSLAYGQHVVVEDLNLSVRSGEFWCCLGPNGAGKSTFMQAILGNLRPTQGELWRHPGLQRHTHVGFVPQRCEMPPVLPTTVREFVMLGAVGLRLARQEWRQRLEWALDSVGLHHMARQSYWTLSGGQQQRALVARALLRRPRLMLLDEPTNNLDLPTAEALLQLLVSLKQREHLTLFWVAHDVAMAARYATHALLLFNRHALAGTTHEVLTAFHLSRAYGVPLDISRDTSGSLAVRVNMPEHLP